MLPFHQVVAKEFEAVNQLIIDELHSDVGLVENIGQYLIDAGGKRLRPLLVLLVHRALRIDNKQQDLPMLRLAAVIEFIHSATLLHDDVVDDSNLRRGRPTANAEWGNAPSVLVGDFLYSRAFQIMVAIGDMRVMKILSDTTNTISEGEVQQLVNARDPEVGIEAYEQVIHKKTAALFEAAAETAAVIAEVDENICSAMRAYGYHLGMAFQLIDDALDYDGDADKLGKNLGDDLAEGKPTLPLILAMQRGTPTDAECIAEAIREGQLDKLNEVAAIVRNTGALQATIETAKEHADQAAAQLSKLQDSPYKQALQQLAEFSVQRDH